MASNEIRIVPSKPREDGFALAQGTKVFSGDAEINGIKSIDVHYKVDEAVTATIEIFSAMDEVGALATYMVSNPKTGKLQAVKRVEFEDGSVWETGCVS